MVIIISGLLQILNLVTELFDIWKVIQGKLIKYVLVVLFFLFISVAVLKI